MFRACEETIVNGSERRGNIRLDSEHSQQTADQVSPQQTHHGEIEEGIELGGHWFSRFGL